MRFMIIIHANADTEAGVMPPPEAFEAMGKFNEALIEAGVLLAAEGLHSSASGKRISRVDGKNVVKDGPFAETKELVAGFWIISAKSMDEAMAWANRVPLSDGDSLEVRRAHEASDFAEVVPQSEIDKEQAWRDANQKPITA
jgi:hypothetical protein